MASIILLRDGQMIPFPLTEAEFAIGRNSDAQIHLDERDVSRTHARIFRKEGTWQLEDRKSSGGTFLNGKRLLPEQPETLDHGDVIRVSSIKLQFENEEESSSVRRKKLRTGFEFSEDSESSIQGSAVNSGYGLLTVRPEEKLRGILKINEALAGNVDFRVICPRVLDALFEIFPQADRGAILFLQDDDEVPLAVAERHRNPTDTASLRISRAILNQVLRENSAILSTNTPIDPRMADSDSIFAQTLQSTMCVPMLGLDGRPFGVISLDSQNPKQRFSDEDLQLLLAVASQASHSFENARLLTSYMEQRKHAEEMQISAQVQRKLIPEVLPQPAGYRFYGSYHAALAVGGDYFDCFEMPDGKICVSFGDVSGKGVPAALIMSRLSGIVRNTMNFTDDIGLAMFQINKLMCSNMIEGRFVTYILGVIDPISHSFTFANAGHIPPEVRSPKGELSCPGTGNSGLPIGIDSDHRFATSTLQLAAGTSIFLRTDGVDDAMSAGKEFYGHQRFRDVLRIGPADPEIIGRALLADVKAFIGGHKQHDDITIMSFGRLP